MWTYNCTNRPSLRTAHLFASFFVQHPRDRSHFAPVTSDGETSDKEEGMKEGGIEELNYPSYSPKNKSIHRWDGCFFRFPFSPFVCIIPFECVVCEKVYACQTNPILEKARGQGRKTRTLTSIWNDPNHRRPNASVKYHQNLQMSKSIRYLHKALIPPSFLYIVVRACKKPVY